MENANGVIKKLTSAERSYYTAAEVREMMGVSRDTAYRMIRSDQMAGEAKIFCYVCEECRYYDGNLKNKDMRCKQCENYIVTNEHAERLRKKIKVVKK